MLKMALSFALVYAVAAAAAAAANSADTLQQQRGRVAFETDVAAHVFARGWSKGARANGTTAFDLTILVTQSNRARYPPAPSASPPPPSRPLWPPASPLPLLSTGKGLSWVLCVCIHPHEHIPGAASVEGREGSDQPRATNGERLSGRQPSARRVARCGRLESMLLDAADPSSPAYGRWLSKDQVDALLAPPPSGVAAVVSALVSAAGARCPWCVRARELAWAKCGSRKATMLGPVAARMRLRPTLAVVRMANPARPTNEGSPPLNYPASPHFQADRNITACTHSRNGDVVKCETTIAAAEALLATEFHHFTHAAHPEHRVIRATRHYSLPHVSRAACRGIV